jgi:hypothetical protein
LPLFVIHYVDQLEQTIFLSNIFLKKKNLSVIAFNKWHHKAFATQPLSICMQVIHSVDIAIVFFLQGVLITQKKHPVNDIPFNFIKKIQFNAGRHAQLSI